MIFMDCSYENAAALKGYKYICGIDEAGRGPLAGPVCAAAVILPPDFDIENLDDSKKLSEKKRELLYDVITEKALAWSVAMATHKEIDEINILQATFLAMKRAVEGLSLPADYAIVDGNRMPPLDIDGETVVKGDSKCPSVAAAAILAKVTRDRFMYELDKKLPEYAFAKHKGYGTALHYERIAQYGVSEYHRLTFLKTLKEHINDKK